jgi:hypothetical protein
MRPTQNQTHHAPKRDRDRLFLALRSWITEEKALSAATHSPREVARIETNQAAKRQCRAPCAAPTFNQADAVEAVTDRSVQSLALRAR